MSLSPEKIAQVCHEANRGYQAVVPSLTVPVAPPWDLIPGQERQTVVSGVKHALDNPGLTGRDSHENWCRDKEADGWVYGPQKDPEAKTHPCLVDYDDLPLADRMKDDLFLAIVGALSGRDE
jgi:hypothetical protein